MRITTLLLVAVAFAGGIAVGTQRAVRLSPLLEALKAHLPGQAAKCADIYQGFPLSPVYNVAELQPGKHPIPGLAHVTVHGSLHHGLKNVELWMETFAPGTGTPIHRHDCEEIWLIVSGTATAYIQDKDGTVAEAALGPNSTFAVLPNARHQVRNTGSEDLHAVIAIDNPPFRPFLYKSWDAPYEAAQEVFPMFWDKACPDYVPESMRHLVAPPSSGAAPAAASSGSAGAEL